MKKIVICGGHLTPALALIENLEKEKNVEIVFFGREFSTEGNKNMSAEYRIVSKKKIKFVKITAGKIQRRLTEHTLISLLKIPVGFLQCFLNLIIIRPSIVVSFGGYLSTPAVFSAWLLGIDSISHEQPSIPGLASRINGLFSKKIFLSWEESKNYFNKEKCEVIGNLIRKSFFEGKGADTKITSFFKKNPKVIFVTGGNQGSHFLNTKVQELHHQLKDFAIIHQVGTVNFEGDFDKAKKIKSAKYLAVDYLDSESAGFVFKNSKLIISRSGANTVWEIAAFGRPALFVPLPNSAYGEQMENAKILERVGSAAIISQEEATLTNLKTKTEEIVKRINELEKNAEEFAKTLPKNSTQNLAKYILE